MTDAFSVVVADVAALLDGPGRFLVGITGPPGAGKSTLALALVDAVGAAYVPMDGFHLSNAQLTRLGRRDRKGAVDTFDIGGYVAALERVSAAYGVADVYIPDFDRAIEEPVAAGLLVAADSRIVVTEGNYLGLSTDGWSPVRALLDRLYYVDCPIALRRSRLVERHRAGGRSLAAAEAWVDLVDEPNARLIAGTRDRCDRSFMLEG